MLRPAPAGGKHGHVGNETGQVGAARQARSARARRELVTPDLFADEPEPEVAGGGRSDLMGALDALNQRFGRQAVSVASAARRAGPSAHASKQDRRSPRYTTRIDEIAVARA